MAPKMVRCPDCGGEGTLRAPQGGGLFTCPECEGTGRITEERAEEMADTRFLDGQEEEEDDDDEEDQYTP